MANSTFMESYSPGDLDRPGDMASIYMYATRDQRVQLYNKSSTGFLYTIKADSSFEVMGRRRGTDEYLVKFGNDKYAYMHLDASNYYNDNGGYDSPALYTASRNYGGSFNFGKYEKSLGDSKVVEGAESVRHFNQFMDSLYAMDNADANATDPVDNEEVEGVSFDIAVNSLGETIVTPDSVNNEAAAKTILEPTIMSYGLPPQWTKYVDPRVMGFTTGTDNAGVDLLARFTMSIGSTTSGFRAKVGLGRRYTEVTISNPTILELAPGFMKYSNWLSRPDISQAISDFSNSGGEVGAQSLIADFAEQEGSFYTIKPCFLDQLYSMTDDNASRANQFGGYMSYVNILLGMAAVFLSRAEVSSISGSQITDADFKVRKYYSDGTSDMQPPLSRRMPPNMEDTKTYAQMDWTMYDKRSGFITVGGYVIGAAGGASNGDASSNASATMFDYIKFYLTGSTTAQDQFQTSVEDSFLGNLANTLNTAVKEAAYWANSLGGGLLNDIAQGAKDVIDSVTINGANPLQNIFAIPEMLGGAKLVFPQIITESKYGKSISCECTFPSIYGDEEAVYINTLRSYLHILAFVLPHQVRTNLDMYTFPFIVKAFCRGLFNVEMGAITSFSVQRGGQDNTLWSFNGPSEIISVEFEITPLINQLVMSSRQDGIGWLMKNKGLQEYLSAISAFDARNDQFELALDLFRAMFNNRVAAKFSGILTPLAQSQWVSTIINVGRAATYGEGMSGLLRNLENDTLSDWINFTQTGSGTTEQTWNDMYGDLSTGAMPLVN